MNIALFCPDYGNQFVGMAKELYDHSRLVQEYFEEASTCLNSNFVRLCFASSEQELSQITNAYTSLFLVSCSIAALLKEKGIKLSLMGGFGVGSFSAAQIAGSLTLPDGLYFLSKLTQLYHEMLNSIAFKAINISKLSIDTIKSLVHNQSNAAIAIINRDQEAIVTGHTDAIEHIKDNATVKGGSVTEVAIEHGLHSPLMDPVIEPLRVYLEKIDFRDAQAGLISSIDGTVIHEGSDIQHNIMNELRSTVRADLIMERMAQDTDMVIIAGIDHQYKALLNTSYPELPVFSVNTLSDIDALLSNLEQKKVDHT